MLLHTKNKKQKRKSMFIWFDYFEKNAVFQKDNPDDDTKNAPDNDAIVC